MKDFLAGHSNFFAGADGYIASSDRVIGSKDKAKGDKVTIFFSHIMLRDVNVNIT